MPCPYKGCCLECSSEYHHRARYARISESKKRVPNEKTTRSNKIDWSRLNEIGNYLPIN